MMSRIEIDFNVLLFYAVKKTFLLFTFFLLFLLLLFPCDYWKFGHFFYFLPFYYCDCELWTTVVGNLSVYRLLKNLIIQESNFRIFLEHLKWKPWHSWIHFERRESEKGLISVIIPFVDDNDEWALWTNDKVLIENFKHSRTFFSTLVSLPRVIITSVEC